MVTVGETGSKSQHKIQNVQNAMEIKWTPQHLSSQEQIKLQEE